MNSLIKMYQDLKESASTSDFPNILANSMYKLLIDKFKGVNSPWRQYTWQTEVADFKTADRDFVNEAPDLEEVLEDGVYKDSKLGDNKWQIQLTTFGRVFSIGRRVIINDDLNALKNQPARFGRAAGRTIAKKSVGMLTADGNTYDGYSLFHHSEHGNIGDTALANTAAGATALANAMTAIEKATDETGEKMGLTAKYLLVCPDLEDIAMRLIRAREIEVVSTTGGSKEPGKIRRLQVLVEPFFDSTTCWYVLADPEEAPAIEVTFLKGKQTPDLLVLKPTAANLAGGDDPFGYEFDDLSYKVRYDFGHSRAMYQGIYRGHS